MKIKFISFFRIVSYALVQALLLSTSSNSQIILSEIMFDPIGSEYYNEFIELYNTSQSDTVDLAGWQISDSSDVDVIIDHDRGTRLNPQQYAVILDPGYFENSSQYENLIPMEALVLTIDDGAFGSQGLSNSYAEPIILISSAGDTIARYRYSLDNQPGYSDEKINLLGDDSRDNWANSKRLNGTPGFENSMQQFDFDIKIELLGFPPETLPGRPITLIASIINIGINNASNIKISFFDDANFDSSLSIAEQIGDPEFIAGPVAPGQNYQTRTVIDSLSSGPHNFYARAYFALDQDSSNNLASSIVKIGFQPGQILINEIMYRPAAAGAEWIELYNPTDRPVNLKSWQFSDAHIENRIVLTDSAILIGSKSYLVIAEDSSIYQNFQTIPCRVIIPAAGFPALNNNGDQIVLYDLIDSIIDQVNYEPAWGNEAGVSLERIRVDKPTNNPTNWALSKNINGGTPGFRNSIAPADFDLAITTINYTPPNPFPGGEITISVLVANVGYYPISGFQLSCFIDWSQDSIFQENEQIDGPVTIGETLDIGDSVVVPIPVTPNQSGIYLIGAIVDSDQDINSSNNTCTSNLSVAFEKNSLVINEIMYSPPSEQPEWIELFNPQDISVDVQQWSFSDSDSSERQIITQNLFTIAPQSFLILSADSSILDYFDLNGSPLVAIKNWQRLNDDSDRIFVFDANKNVIDGIYYTSNWGGNDGVSLERINPKLASNDSSNWCSCVLMAKGGTPGRTNSIYVEMLPTAAELTIAPNPFSPDGDGKDDFTIISYQLPFNLSRIQIKIFDVRGRQVRYLVNNQPSGISNTIIWDGRDDRGFICRMGIYIVYLEAIHYQQGVVKSLKKSVVLAKQL